MSSWTEILRGRLGVYTLMLNIGILFFAVDNFLVNTLMPSIVADIGGVAFYAWAMMLYLVGSITGSASYGPMRARIGGRRTFAVGGAVFSLGALGCSIAPSMGALLVARLVQGVGGGLILATSMAFMGVARSGEESNTASSLSTIRALGMAFGAAVAGTIGNIAGLQKLATPDTVRTAVTWVYLFNVLPLILAAAVAARFFQVAEPYARGEQLT